MQFRIAGFDNAPDQGNRDQHCIIVAQQRFSDCVDHGSISPVDPRGQNVIELDHMQFAGIGIAFDKVRCLGICHAGICPFCPFCSACLNAAACQSRVTCPAGLG